MTAVAVNCLPTDPDWKTVSGFTGTCNSTLESQNLLPARSFRRAPPEAPGPDMLALHLCPHIIANRIRGCRFILSMGDGNKEEENPTC